MGEHKMNALSVLEEIRFARFGAIVRRFVMAPVLIDDGCSGSSPFTILTHAGDEDGCGMSFQC